MGSLELDLLTPCDEDKRVNKPRSRLSFKKITNFIGGNKRVESPVDSVTCRAPMQHSKSVQCSKSPKHEQVTPRNSGENKKSSTWSIFTKKRSKSPPLSSSQCQPTESFSPPIVNTDETCVENELENIDVPTQLVEDAPEKNTRTFAERRASPRTKRRSFRMSKRRRVIGGKMSLSRSPSPAKGNEVVKLIAEKSSSTNESLEGRPKSINVSNESDCLDNHLQRPVTPFHLSTLSLPRPKNLMHSLRRKKRSRSDLSERSMDLHPSSAGNSSGFGAHSCNVSFDTSTDSTFASFSLSMEYEASTGAVINSLSDVIRKLGDKHSQSPKHGRSQSVSPTPVTVARSRSCPTSKRRQNRREICQEVPPAPCQGGSYSTLEAIHLRGYNSSPGDTVDRTIQVVGLETDKRFSPEETTAHIFFTMLDTEKSYVSSLRHLIKNFLEPLYQKPEVCEEYLLNYMLFRLPDILAHHEVFLKKFEERMDSWTPQTVIGDLLVETFSNAELRDSYTAFISNFKRAKEAKAISSTKESFIKHAEQCQKSLQTRFTLDDLMIKPVQRIPRYPLLIKDLIQNIAVTHPDYEKLTQAFEVLKSLAISINAARGNSEDGTVDIFSDMNYMIEGLGPYLNINNRQIIRQDFVLEMIQQRGWMEKNILVRKDRVLILCNDSLVCVAVKNKKSSSRRGSMNLSNINGLDPFVKYKLCWKYPLPDLDALDSTLCRKSADQSVISRLEEDLNKLNDIINLADSLFIPHGNLVEQARRTQTELSKHVADVKQFSSQDVIDSKVELAVNSSTNLETISLIFQSVELRTEWENEFNRLKETFSTVSPSLVVQPEFIKNITLKGPLSGTHLTCLCHLASKTYACASDGIIYQIQLDSPKPVFEPVFHSPSAPIVAAVALFLTYTVQSLNYESVPLSPSKLACPNPVISVVSIETDTSDEDSVKDVSFNEKKELPPAWYSFDSSIEEDNTRIPTIWIGCSDGTVKVLTSSHGFSQLHCLHSYNAPSPITCLAQSNTAVFVGCQSGTLLVFNLESGISESEFLSPKQCSLSSKPITALTVSGERIWCASGNILAVLQILDLSEKVRVELCRSDHTITCLTSSGFGIWIGFDKSSVIQLYHSIHYQHITDVNLEPMISEFNQGVSSSSPKLVLMVTHRDQLIIATSIGTLLCLSVPLLNPSSCDFKGPLRPVTLPVRHNGKVKLLLSAINESEPPATCTTTKFNKRLSISPSLKLRGTTRFRAQSFSHRAGHYIISVGEGCTEIGKNQPPKNDKLFNLILWQ